MKEIYFTQVYCFMLICKISIKQYSIEHSEATAYNVITTICISHINPLKPELNPICYLLALLAHHFLHVSRIRVKSLTLR